MSYSTTVISVMIASPSDVIAEREAARDVIHDWNNTHAGPKTAVLLPIGWDTHTSPELGKPPQEIINERVLRDSDLLVGIFWQRLGTPTGGYPSGSVEEIRHHIDAGKPALVYFSDAPPAPDADQAQLAALAQFREWCRANGLPRPYKDSHDFEKHFARDLQLALRDHPYLRLRAGAASRAAGEDQSGFGKPMIVLAPAGSTLLEESRQLLLEAAKDPSGVILFASVMGGTIIQTNGKQFGIQGDARSMARWRRALDELAANSFVEPRGSKRELFFVTDRGYKLADRLGEASRGHVAADLEAFWNEGHRILLDSAAGSGAWSAEARAWEKKVEERLASYDDAERVMFATLAFQTGPSAAAGTHAYGEQVKARQVAKLDKLRLIIGRAYSRKATTNQEALE